MFNLVIGLGSPAVDIFQALRLVVDDVPGNTIGENKLEGRVNALVVSPGERVQSLELRLGASPRASRRHAGHRCRRCCRHP